MGGGGLLRRGMKCEKGSVGSKWIERVCLRSVVDSFGQHGAGRGGRGRVKGDKLVDGDEGLQQIVL